MKNRRVFWWMLSLLPLLLCFEASAYAQDPPRIRPSTNPTCTVDIRIFDNKDTYSTGISLYRGDGTPVLKVPRVITPTHYKLMFLDVGTYTLTLRGKYRPYPPVRSLSCQQGKTSYLSFKIVTP